MIATVRRLTALLCCVTLLAATDEPRSVTATNGAAVGGNVTNSSITVGLSDRQIRSFIDISTRRWQNLTDAQRRQLAELQHRLGVSEGALRNFFATLGQSDAPARSLPERLGEIARRYIELQQQLSAIGGDSPNEVQLKWEVQQAAENGHYTQADALLQRIAAAQDSAIESCLSDRASIAASRGLLAMIQSDYVGTATHFAEAVRLAPPNHRDSLSFKLLLSEALYRKGEEQGDNSALMQSASVAGDLIMQHPEDHWRQVRAVGQYHKGRALGVLGGRTGDSAQLAAAADAYRAASLEFRRETAPLEWASIQQNLGILLSVVARYQGARGQLDEALVALQNATLEFTKQRTPIAWAMTKNSIANTTMDIAEWSGDANLVDQAAGIYREALDELTAADNPSDWAMVQSGLGVASTEIGRRERNAVILDGAIDQFRSALSVLNQADAPIEWANAQNGLGNALVQRGQLDLDRARFERAVEAFRSALRVRARDRTPHDWASTQVNLGIALACIGFTESGLVHLNLAIAVHEQVADPDGAWRPRTRAAALLNLSLTQLELGRRTGDRSLLDRAEGQVAKAHDIASVIKNDVLLRRGDGILRLIKNERALPNDNRR